MHSHEEYFAGGVEIYACEVDTVFYHPLQTRLQLTLRDVMLNETVTMM